MHRSTSKQRQLIRRVMVYALMVAVITSLVTVLVLLMLGYRFDKDNQSVQQGGLVQFISRPSGAKITVGKAKLSNLTPTKITVNPGQYATTMSRSGYRTWTKTVDVLAGHVLWLNYVQLVPNTIVTKPVLAIGDTDGVLASANGKKLAYFSKNQPQVVKITRIDTDSPKITELSLPKGMLPTNQSSAPTLRYWSKDSDTLLASVKVGKEVQWLYIDTNAPKKSINISTTYDLAIQAARFDPGSNTRLVVNTTDGDVRTIDMNSGSLSAVLVKKVKTFSLFEDELLLYVYTNDENKPMLGYLTLGETKGRDLPIAADNVNLIAGGEYFNKGYIAVTSSRLMRVYRLESLPNSTSTNTISSTLVFSTPLTETPLFASVHNSGRFIIEKTKNGYSTYDIELDKFTSTKFGMAQTQELRWLDGYHVFFSGKDSLEVAEFDGTNGYRISSANAWVGSLLNDGKYLYSITKTDSGYSVQRSQMLLN